MVSGNSTMKPKRTPVPPGWRRLRVGEWPRASDRVEHYEGGFKPMGKKWYLELPVVRGESIIRRVPRKETK